MTQPTHPTPTSFRVGDHVRLPLGRRTVGGVVTEDRGPIGAGGKRFYQVQVPQDPLEPMLLEMAEDELEADPTGSNSPQLDKTKVLKYLTHGGLVSILAANTQGGKNQPRVWLCLDSLGNVTHTFSAERGILGGQTVPFWTLEEDRIFLPKKEMVAAFLRSFGLTKREIDQIMASVGTAP